MQYERVAVIGIGQMGASFALAGKKHDLIGHVIGVARTEATRRNALQTGAADECTEDAAAAVQEADLVYLSVPVGAMGTVMKTIAPALKAGCVITDAGSTKEAICRLAGELLPDRVQFIGGHPMAGTERQGPLHADATLFEGTTYLLCPGRADDDTLDAFMGLIRAIGAEPVIVDEREHDRMLAYSSHLPHLTAVVLSIALADSNVDELAQFGAGGLRDTTRIAAGSVEMWRDIFSENRRHILTAAKELRAILDATIEAIEDENVAEIERLLDRAHRFRSDLYSEN
ncbi:MAG: prephenate dehydrogenase/arogenate dehydrogenase family protein [Armatimonadota bacterium]